MMSGTTGLQQTCPYQSLRLQRRMLLLPLQPREGLQELALTGKSLTTAEGAGKGV